ncbi:MAG: hypothetical protein KDB90_02020 [Planctomycetes bacterium]|nr:hypothetical protein [Planctomycetota bacterium]
MADIDDANEGRKSYGAAIRHFYAEASAFPDSQLPHPDGIYEPEHRWATTYLEGLVTATMSKWFPEWGWHESVDGFQLSYIRSTGPNEIEFAGKCILISDQTLALIRCRLRAEDTGGTVKWMECWFGEKDPKTGALLREPYDNDPLKRIRDRGLLVEELESVKWKWHFEAEDVG